LNGNIAKRGERGAWRKQRAGELAILRAGERAKSWGGKGAAVGIGFLVIF